MKSTFRVATLQPRLVPDAQERNFQAIDQCVMTMEGDHPSDVIVLPEFWDGRSRSNGLSEEELETAFEEACRFLGALARRARAHVIGGSLPVTVQGERRNRCVVFDRRGEQVGHYDKRRLFSGERKTRRPGAEVGVFEWEGVSVGVLICADLWWPELARDMIDRVDLLCVPAKTSLPDASKIAYARRLWHALALTRAFENGLVVAVSDWAGPPSEESRPNDPASTEPFESPATAGATTLCDPSRRPDDRRIQLTLPVEYVGALTATIDFQKLETYRAYRRGVGLLPAAPLNREETEEPGSVGELDAPAIDFKAHPNLDR